MNLIEEADDKDDKWDDGGGGWHGKRHASLVDNAPRLALLNMSIADAAIGCWDAKWVYQYWRPVTAIPEADADGNPDTAPDATWAPLFPTPNHSEYPSGHSCLSGAAGFVLASLFGEHTRFEMTSDTMPGVVRSFKSFSAALDEVKNARIYAGIHFRTATTVGQILGRSVGAYVLGNALRPLD